MSIPEGCSTCSFSLTDIDKIVEEISLTVGQLQKQNEDLQKYQQDFLNQAAICGKRIIANNAMIGAINDLQFLGPQGISCLYNIRTKSAEYPITVNGSFSPQSVSMGCTGPQGPLLEYTHTHAPTLISTVTQKVNQQLLEDLQNFLTECGMDTPHKPGMPSPLMKIQEAFKVSNYFLS